MSLRDRQELLDPRESGALDSLSRPVCLDAEAFSNMRATAKIWHENCTDSEENVRCATTEVFS